MGKPIQNNKECLELMLQGKIPDRLTYFEFVFQIAKEMSGMGIDDI